MTTPVRCTRRSRAILGVLDLATTANTQLSARMIMDLTRVSLPFVFRVLETLYTQRWLTASWQENTTPGTPRHRVYHLSPHGHQQVPALKARWLAHRQHPIRSLLRGDRPVIHAAHDHSR